MSIEDYIRAKTSELIRPFVIKEECEFCGVSSDLHMHHVEPFAIMLKEAHEVLDINYGAYDDYSEEEKDILTNHMLGVQLQSNYLTLCVSCHSELHSEEDSLFEIGEAGLNSVELRRKKKEKQEDDRVKRELLPYLVRSKGNVMLNMADRQELIEMVNVRNEDNNRLVRGICAINKKLAEHELPFEVESYSTSRIINGKKKNFGAAWRILQTKNYIPDVEGVVVNAVGGHLLVNKQYKYADLCRIFREEPKDGTSKPAQISKWEKELGIKFIKKPRAYLKVVW